MSALVMVPNDAAALSDGYRRARAVTAHHAKSFFFSSLAMFGARRRGAFALYAFCRRLDDLVDGDTAALGAATLSQRLELARQAVHRLYEGSPVEADFRSPLSASLRSSGSLRSPVEAQGLWHPNEWLAVRHTVQTFDVPKAPLLALIDGMEMDLSIHRYASWSELDLYCHRVAGVVGLMMSPLLGCTDERALASADALGKGMQLTNILRDVKEDLARGRVYLPADELKQFGITDAQLHEGKVDDAFRAFMKFQISRARSLYAQADAGIPYLSAFGAQRLTRLMSSIYGGILREIEKRDYDVFSARARVSGAKKVAHLVKVLVTPNPPLRPLLPEGRL